MAKKKKANVRKIKGRAFGGTTNGIIATDESMGTPKLVRRISSKKKK